MNETPVNLAERGLREFRREIAEMQADAVDLLAVERRV